MAAPTPQYHHPQQLQWGYPPPPPPQYRVAAGAWPSHPQHNQQLHHPRQQQPQQQQHNNHSKSNQKVPPKVHLGPPPQHHNSNTSVNKNKQKRKDKVAPPDKLTVDPKVRAPQSETERKEIEQWIAERRKFFPTAANLARKKGEADARADRGELEPLVGGGVMTKQQRLKDILARQEAMGVLKQAGTQDLFQQVMRMGGGGGGGGGREGGRGERGGGRRGRGRGRGGGGNGSNYSRQQAGWEAFASAAEPPQQQQQQQQETVSQVSGQKRKAEEHPEEKPQPNMGGIQMLAQAYGSDADSDAKNKPDINNGDGKDGAHIQQQHRYNKGREAKRGRGGGRKGPQHHQQRHTNNYNQRRQQHPPNHPPAPPSLLEKLLTKEIHQDHSHLLQSFRFLVNNSFLVDYKPGSTCDGTDGLKFPPPKVVVADTDQVKVEEKEEAELSSGSLTSTDDDDDDVSSEEEVGGDDDDAEFS